jgi:chorismate lyase/3-hydroxybenzoate synthase
MPQAPIKIQYAPYAALTAHDLASEQLLTVISYGGLVLPQPRCPLVAVPLPQLGTAPHLELWSCATFVERGRYGNIEYGTDGEVLFGVCQRSEPATALLDEITYDMYADVIRMTNAKGYPQLLRIWNYFGDINGIQKGEQRYHRFCAGRHQALVELKPDFEQALPAASVIGTRDSGVTVYFLAAREPGTPVENPRQLSAYRYPAQYSPQSPSFSRAMLKLWRQGVHLYVSGTASIVGHSTVHSGDVGSQVQEILRNLQALLVQASCTASTEFPGIAEASTLKVYVRRPDDLPLIDDALTQALGRRLSVLYLQGDLCRSDLLVEIEGIYVS